MQRTDHQAAPSSSENLHRADLLLLAADGGPRHRNRRVYDKRSSGIFSRPMALRGRRMFSQSDIPIPYVNTLGSGRMRIKHTQVASLSHNASLRQQDSAEKP
jgi:hypothetical protein